jgi:hypothetical protein
VDEVVLMAEKKLPPAADETFAACPSFSGMEH